MTGSTLDDPSRQRIVSTGCLNRICIIYYRWVLLLYNKTNTELDHCQLLHGMFCQQAKYAPLTNHSSGSDKCNVCLFKTDNQLSVVLCDPVYIIVLTRILDIHGCV